MDLLLLFVCIIILLAFSLLIKRAWPIFVILLLCCFILMGYNTQNPDYDNYVKMFYNATYLGSDTFLSKLDASNKALQVFFKELGVRTYAQYRLILTGLLMTVLGWFTYRTCVYRNVFLFIYMVCYLILDIVQIRNFEAFVVLMPFIPLLSQKKLVPTLVYVGGVLISATFHFSMIFFILFAFINISSRKVRISLIILSLLVLIPASKVITDSVAFHRVDAYNRSGVLGALFGISFVVLNYFVIKTVSNISLRQSIKKVENVVCTYLDARLMKELNFMLLIMIPFYFVNATVGRLFRFVSIINVIFMLNTIYSIRSYNTKVKLSIVLILYVAYFAIYFIYLKPELCVQILTHNSFIEGLN